MIQEAYVHGISKRAVDDLVKAMGGSGVSKSQVSRLCEEIDERVVNAGPKMHRRAGVKVHQASRSEDRVEVALRGRAIRPLVPLRAPFRRRRFERVACSV